MKCSLCADEIRNYSFDFNHLSIDKEHSYDICQDCIDKFNKWQQKLMARLFPTKAMKERFGNQ